MESIKIVVDKDIVESYYKEYFEKYPRRKAKPIPGIFVPSLNRFIALRRMAQNQLKQRYKDFSSWLANKYGIAGLNLDRATIRFRFIFPDHRRRDLDNLILAFKFFNDGFVDSKVFVDDSSEILDIAFEKVQYDKNYPRIEIEIEYGGVKNGINS